MASAQDTDTSINLIEYQEPDLVARLSIDPRLIKLVGRSMYSMHPLPLVTRELLQNARDACLRKGVAPKIQITFRMIARRRCQIVCRDNGIGMTPKQILEDFLCLGGTSKNGDGQNVGGFGIAKAAIMSSETWSVHTLGHYVDLEAVSEGRLIQPAEFLDGTEVTALVERDCYSDNLNQAFLMIALSDVPVAFRMCQVVGGQDEMVFEGTIGGAFQQAKWKKLEAIETSPGWELWGTTGFKTPTFQYDGYYLGGKDHYSGDPHIKGRVFVRVGGLVQFEQSFGRDPKRGSLLFVELKDLPIPGVPEYPLSTSREELKDSFRLGVQSVIMDHCLNPITSSRVIREPKQRIAILPGEMIRGLMKSDGNTPPQNGKRSSSISRFEAVLENTFRSDVTPDDEDSCNGSPVQVKIMLKEYRRRKITLKDWRLMLVWSEVLRLVTCDQEEFGIGITGSEAGAERVTYGGDVYYILNPAYLEGVHTAKGKVLALYDLAKHEAAHREEGGHGEVFTSLMGHRSTQTADDFGKQMARLERILIGKDDPSWMERKKPSQAQAPEQIQLSLNLPIG